MSARPDPTPSQEAKWLGLVAATAGVAGAVGVIGAAAGAGFVTLLKRQAAHARDVIGKPLGETAPDADKTYKKTYGGTPVELLLLGDSIAAGLGAETPKGTLGARLAKGIAKRTERPVRLRTEAVVGAETSMVAEQVAGLPPTYRPDVAVVIVGGNDVTHRVPASESVADLVEIVSTLRERGAQVVVGTCPDVGAVRPLPQPLRTLGRRVARQLAERQAEGALAAGAHVVSLAEVVGPFFITNPDEMFSIDRFHPSAAGYKRTAKAMLPSVLAALGYVEEVPFGHLLPISEPVPEAAADDPEPDNPGRSGRSTRE
ncbi:SGNH/GDSL hydrolase family protein [Nocardioides sp. DS6]|uniref:SGNH/GDSL hydrolase family protein n=1 Tax=Nocardioides eburneus TaxID=3231482 RepID=A0ABV3SUF1_9ACTN